MTRQLSPWPPGRFCYMLSYIRHRDKPGYDPLDYGDCDRDWVKHHPRFMREKMLISWRPQIFRPCLSVRRTRLRPWESLSGIHCNASNW